MRKTPPLRSLFLTLLLIAYVFVYALLVMVFFQSNLRQISGLTEGLAYAFAGFAWLPIAMVIIKAMAKGKKGLPSN